MRKHWRDWLPSPLEILLVFIGALLILVVLQESGVPVQ
jgi:hypothetical protein